mmetsp:Transcript_332/g.704  ORF Transcript_332/g.704 Transcript_332/m.704 type:complete len:85 (+) Transcript_332:347-601(+)
MVRSKVTKKNAKLESRTYKIQATLRRAAKSFLVGENGLCRETPSKVSTSFHQKEPRTRWRLVAAECLCHASAYNTSKVPLTLKL